MKTKLKVLSNNSLYSDSDDALNGRFGEIKSAMDEYAKEVAIDFLHWFQQTDFSTFVDDIEGKVFFIRCENEDDNKHYSNDDVFEEYLKSKSNEQKH